MPIDNVLASVAVRDLEIAEAWYVRLIGAVSSKPMPEVAEWKFPGGGGSDPLHPTDQPYDLLSR